MLKFRVLNVQMSQQIKNRKQCFVESGCTVIVPFGFSFYRVIQYRFSYDFMNVVILTSAFFLCFLSKNKLRYNVALC